MNGSDSAEKILGDVLVGRKPRRKRATKRVALHLEVPLPVREAFFDRARAAGVSGPEYLTNAIALPERAYHTAALKQAKPLTDISYRLSRALDAIQRGEVDAADAWITEAQAIVSEALFPLRREHESDVRANIAFGDYDE